MNIAGEIEHTVQRVPYVELSVNVDGRVGEIVAYAQWTSASTITWETHEADVCHELADAVDRRLVAEGYDPASTVLRNARRTLYLPDSA